MARWCSAGRPKRRATLPAANSATPGAVVAPVPHLPDLVALHEREPDRCPFLLQSAATGGSARRRLGRYDILFCDPGDVLELPANAHSKPDFFAALNARAPIISTAPHELIGDDLPADGLPFVGGWFVFMAYELAAQVEPVLSLAHDERVPVALAVRIPRAIVVCRDTKRAWVVSETDDLAELDTLAASAPATTAVASDGALVASIEEEPPEDYVEAVVQAKEHIAAGDVFQANLSRRWTGQLREGVSGVDVYRRLCATNPAPFAGLMRWRDRYVLSSSPERLAALSCGRIDTRPIAGTRPRGAELDHDEALAIQLIEHPKERAEHVMLIDLERNDLGRVCRPGSVRVDEFMAVESYAHVHHIVSNVSGDLEPSVGPGDALRAVYPGGTITGCPKVRCMQIIAALERTPRGAYTGSMGYLNRDGSGDFNILIRTAVVADARATFRAGAGIVADSDPQAELQETRAKARGLVLALAGSAA